jgi:methylphosphotriester-DNA--protein-cysteine methyltransferase
LFAIPSAPYERYVAKGGHRGFEVVREGVPKAFPDGVILRQTTPGARLEIADHDAGHVRRVRHGRDRFFGMALGVEATRRRCAITAWATSSSCTRRTTALSSAGSRSGRRLAEATRGMPGARGAKTNV